MSAGLAAAGVAFLSGCGFHKFFSPSGWRQPERVVAALSLEPGARVADVGAGDGSREMTDAGFRRTQVFDFLPMLHFQVFSPE